MTAAKPRRKAIPSEIKIGAYTYKVYNDVESWERLLAFDEDAVAVVGSTVLLRAEIYVMPGMPFHVTRDTLIHEILHAIFNQTDLIGAIYALEFPDNVVLEEHLVRGITPWLTTVMVENPELLAYVAQPD